MIRIVVATRNKHKLEEIRAMLGHPFRVESLLEFPAAPEVVEDAPTFEGNAGKKALALTQYLAGLPKAREGWVIADDSGLEVDALNGAPGVFSARFAALDEVGAPAGNSPDSANNAKLLQLLRHVPLEKRTGRFRCVLALSPLGTKPSPVASPVCEANEAELRLEFFSGACEGHIDFEPSGAGGFGYDPLFIPQGYDQSFAELGEEIKNRISHRSKALAALQKRFQSVQ